jgi:hypothetical protein
MRILPRTGHSFYATLILSLAFSAVLGIPEGRAGKQKRNRLRRDEISSGHEVHV